MRTNPEIIRILLVEDSRPEADLMQAMLDQEPYENYVFEHAPRVSVALAALEERAFDVVLLDLLLPDSKGMDTFERIHRQASEDIPIIVLSGIADEELALEAVRRGAQDYLVKGQVTAHILARAIRYAMERKQIEEALRQRTEELKVRNKELDAFAHTVAHDLRSPLTLITGYAELLKEDYTTIPRSKLLENAQIILQYGEKMSTIIDELLLLSSVRHAEITTYEMQMSEIVDSVLTRLAPLIEKQEAEISRPRHWPAAIGYPPWIEEVWFNYLHNALQYGGPTPHIELGGEKRADGKARFWVRDDGPGVPSEQRTKLFTPFTQLNQVKTEGHGLGLSVVKRIIGKLGGEVGVESKVGEGSTFYFILDSPDSIKNS
jgi:signal transduction histidine kinase